MQSFFITKNDVYACGANHLCELFHADRMDINYPAKISIANVKKIETAECFSIALTNNGDLMSAGSTSRCGVKKVNEFKHYLYRLVTLALR